MLLPFDPRNVALCAAALALAMYLAVRSLQRWRASYFYLGYEHALRWCISPDDALRKAHFLFTLQERPASHRCTKKDTLPIDYACWSFGQMSFCTISDSHFDLTPNARVLVFSRSRHLLIHSLLEMSSLKCSGCPSDKAWQIFVHYPSSSFHEPALQCEITYWAA